jgi:hypothetical protein
MMRKPGIIFRANPSALVASRNNCKQALMVVDPQAETIDEVGVGDDDAFRAGVRNYQVCRYPVDRIRRSRR